jgi:Arc/MetJ-type ribon-helix-helix transcriptional regulator
MRIQITVRLPGDLVAFIDEQVSSGAVHSRADAVSRALTRERRRVVALADARILQARATVHDLDELAAFTAQNPVELDD